MPPPYRGVGFCIYCGVAEAESGPKGLSDEHIIPYFLGGTAVLPKSSCEACAAATSAFEGACAKTIFAPTRTHLHWKSRRRKKPTTTRAYTYGGKSTEAIEVPLNEDPAIIVMPDLGPPPVLIGQDYGGGMWQHGVNAYFRPDSLEKLQALSKKGVMATTMFDPDAFAKTLAKIAYAYAVAELGYGSFRSYLPSAILDRPPHAGNYVGSLFGSTTASSRLHEIDLIRYGINIVARVRLYASHNCPTYHVVVGYP